eukprot:33531-Pyramimonas_sp.AAC.1
MSIETEDFCFFFTGSAGGVGTIGKPPEGSAPSSPDPPNSPKMSREVEDEGRGTTKRRLALGAGLTGGALKGAIQSGSASSSGLSAGTGGGWGTRPLWEEETECLPSLLARESVSDHMTSSSAQLLLAGGPVAACAASSSSSPDTSREASGEAGSGVPDSLGVYQARFEGSRPLSPPPNRACKIAESLRVSSATASAFHATNAELATGAGRKGRSAQRSKRTAQARKVHTVI